MEIYTKNHDMFMLILQNKLIITEAEEKDVSLHTNIVFIKAMNNLYILKVQYST